MVDKENYVAEIYSHIQREPQLSETYANFFQDNDLTADTIAQGPTQNDSSEISYYLKSGTNLSYKTYESIKELYDALDKDEVGMIIVPNIIY